MKKSHIIITSMLILVDSMLACSAIRPFNEVYVPEPISNSTKLNKQKPSSYKEFSLKIPLELGDKNAELNAELFRPTNENTANTMIIMVPGSGNISRKGELSTDGINNYEVPFEQINIWSKALSTAGFLVLAYDKRTCTKAINPLCNSNSQEDIDKLGIKALANDLDQVCNYVSKRVSGLDLVLLSTAQGAQVIEQSSCIFKASSVVLLSPIVENLENTWVMGLSKSAEAESNAASNNRLRNRAETIKAFFSSLKKGDFPADAHIRGASVSFWLSWLSASETSTKGITEKAKRALLLFSKKDPFIPPSTINKISKEAAAKKNIIIKQDDKADRNFITDGQMPVQALKAVQSFLVPEPNKLLN